MAILYKWAIASMVATLPKGNPQNIPFISQLYTRIIVAIFCA